MPISDYGGDVDQACLSCLGRELLEKQTQQEDLSCLPSLKLADVDTVIKEEPVENHVLCRYSHVFMQ